MDNKRIAFIRYASDYAGDICTVSLNGGEPKAVTSLNSWIRGLTWHFNEDIIFSSNHAGINNLWEVSTRNKKIKQVAASSLWLLNPTFSNKTGHLA